MEKSWTTVDKSTWGDGPWRSEPDKIQWIDEETGYDCLIVRGPLGALCGYVGVPPEHQCHGVDYDRVRAAEEDEDGWSYIDVHGGLTYAGSCNDEAEECKGICHVPLPGRPHDVWWLGFDCAHSMDVVPGMAARERDMGLSTWADPRSTYRSVFYVKREVADLARQLVTATVGEER